MSKNPDLIEVFADFKRLKANEEESRREVEKLHTMLRKQRLF